MIIIDAMIFFAFWAATWYMIWLAINASYLAGEIAAHQYREMRRSFAMYKLNKAEGVIDIDSRWYKAERLFNTCTFGKFA